MCTKSHLQIRFIHILRCVEHGIKETTEQAMRNFAFIIAALIAISYVAQQTEAVNSQELLDGAKHRISMVSDRG